MYIIIGLIIFSYLFISFLIQFMIDILILSVVGFLFSRLVRLKLKFKSIFNISIYAITLPIILYLVYGIVNLYTGFSIRYFEIAYNAISYIYVVTAILIIRNDLIKQQIEVGKIVKEELKIREEKKLEEKEKQKEDNKENKPKKDKTKKQNEENKKENKDETPEGNEA